MLQPNLKATILAWRPRLTQEVKAKGKPLLGDQNLDQSQILAYA